MRLNSINSENIEKYEVIVVDDEQGILDSIKVYLNDNKYNVTTTTDPLNAIELVKTGKFDLMVLDYMMMPIHGDEVVERVREFNKDLYILLLTGHKDLVPPLETIRRLDIQGYCEKTSKLDQVVVLIESGIKSVNQKREIKKINIELNDTNEKLEKAYVESIQTIISTVDAKDPYTKGHSYRVAEYAVLIAKKLNLSEEDIKTIKLGGLFHDVGKIGVSDSILRKNDKLTDDEYSEIKNHPSIGVNILLCASIFAEIIPIVKHHHERYDGNGYPGKLKGENIPYFARIISVADAFDAMNSKRAYRDNLNIDVIKQEMTKNLGIQFDVKIGNAFLDILNNNYDEIKKIEEQF